MIEHGESAAGKQALITSFGLDPEPLRQASSKISAARGGFDPNGAAQASLSRSGAAGEL